MQAKDICLVVDYDDSGCEYRARITVRFAQLSRWSATMTKTSRRATSIRLDIDGRRSLVDSGAAN